MTTLRRKTKRKPIKKINHSMKKKLSILLFCVLGALIVLLGVITYINFQSGDKYKKQVLSQDKKKKQKKTSKNTRIAQCQRNEGQSMIEMETFWQRATRCIMLYWTVKL